jgi:hypothetical protein
VTLRRPKFVFDTQVISYLSDGTIPRAEWDAVRKFMSKRARYAISSITLYELVAGIEGGDEAHFRENQRRLKVLCEPEKRKFLPLPGDFVRSAVFGLALRNQAFQPHKLRTWIEVISSAEAKKDLKDGRVTLRGGTNKTYGSSLSLFADQIRQGKQADAIRLEKLRKGLLNASTQETWSRALLARIDVPSDPANVMKLQTALDAAWRYELARYELAKSQHYDFARHDSDWLDGQLVYYLADPLIHFVTADAKIKHRTQDSSQADRILGFGELKEMAQAAR